MKVYKSLFVLLLSAVIAVPASGQFERQMREPGTPFYHVQIVRYPTAIPDSSKIRLYLKVPYDDLQFVKYDSVYRSSYEVSIVVFDKDGIQADGDIQRHKITVSAFEQTNAQGLFDYSNYSFLLHNSVYKVSIGLMDMDTRKTTYRKFTVDLMKFNPGPIKLSDLLIVDNVKSVSQDSTDFQPNVVNRLDDKQKEFYIYYTAAGPAGSATVEAAILTTDGNSLKTVNDTISLGSEPQPHLLKMATDGLSYSKYIYQIKVTSGKETSVRKQEFRVAWVGLSGFVSNLDKAIQEMIYIMPGSEVNKMKKDKPEEKKKLFMEYWKKKDPSPETETNELMNEYFRRVNYANQQFGSSFKEGWRSDMGMVYILFGAPNDIERHPFDLGSKPYEIWYYFEINRQFVFVDDSGFGDYRLVTPLYDLYNSSF